MGGPAIIDGVDHYECGNFYIRDFIVNDVTYPSSEHYFQCMKAVDKKDHDNIKATSTPMASWCMGNKIKIRNDWELVKVNFMYDGNFAKFSQNEDLAALLISSQGEIKCNASTNFWNKWNEIILTRIRAELRNTDEDLIVAEKCKNLMQDYENSIKK